LKDVWPTQEEVPLGGREVRAAGNVHRPLRQRLRRDTAMERHQDGRRRGSSLARFSTYIQEPPFLIDLPKGTAARSNRYESSAPWPCSRLRDDRPHFAGRQHRQEQPAGKFLVEKGVQPVDFNSYGARRGNDA